jgi:hypothetical protein
MGGHIAFHFNLLTVLWVNGLGRGLAIIMFLYTGGLKYTLTALHGEHRLHLVCIP